MTGLTVRDLPDRTISILKSRANLHHRSLNGEILHLFEYIVAFGDRFEFSMTVPEDSNVEHQKQTILRLAGKWEDDRSYEEMVADIEGARSKSREVEI